MAVILANFVWEGTNPERLTDPYVLANKVDGHIFKELDTGESYIHRNGDWEYINLGLSFIKATKSGNATTDASGEVVITFTTPLIDDLYSVALSVSDDGSKTPVASFYNKTTNGFSIRTRNATSGQLVGGVDVG